MSSACSMNRDKRNAYMFLVGNRTLGKPEHMWVHNIKMELR
jgi:hypothetical protein